jgi:uncharacterized membrane protein YbhN (UPF0104 family)
MLVEHLPHDFADGACGADHRNARLHVRDPFRKRDDGSEATVFLNAAALDDKSSSEALSMQRQQVLHLLALRAQGATPRRQTRYNRDMFARLRRWMPWLKLVFTVAILVCVGWFFVRLLNSEEVRQPGDVRSAPQIIWDEIRSARVGALVVAGVLYLIGLGFSWGFWQLLLRRVGEPLPLLIGLRTYYISHLGKYAPVGKGWALLMRTMLAHQGGVRIGFGALTGAYETLTMMASGALLAAVLLLSMSAGIGEQFWLALGLLALAGIPILPGVLNRIVRRIAARFNTEHLALPPLGTSTPLIGLALAVCGWIFLGASLLAVLRALNPDTPGDLLLCTSAVAVSWVAGFVASTPGGLGPRELLLQQALAPTIGPRPAIVAVILLRLLWTVAELVCAAVVYWFPATRAIPSTGVEPEPGESPSLARAEGSPVTSR